MTGQVQEGLWWGWLCQAYSLLWHVRLGGNHDEAMKWSDIVPLLDWDGGGGVLVYMLMLLWYFHDGQCLDWSVYNKHVKLSVQGNPHCIILSWKYILCIEIFSLCCWYCIDIDLRTRFSWDVVTRLCFLLCACGYYCYHMIFGYFIGFNQLL